MLITAGGLVSHGGMSRRFRAFDVDTGQTLWEAIQGQYHLHGQRQTVHLCNAEPRAPTGHQPSPHRNRNAVGTVSILVQLAGYCRRARCTDGTTRSGQ